MQQMTWRELVKREPLLGVMYRKAKAERLRHRESKVYCANRTWFDEFEEEFQRLVGWDARVQDGYVNTSEAYDVAFERIYKQLPDCKGCACIGA